MTLNLNTLETVTETAKAKASGQAAWVRAIEKAAEQLITNPYISEYEGGLLILSYSNETYHANGACQCKAYANGMACWHRAAAKLVKRYREAEAAQQAAPAPAVETVTTDDRSALIADIKTAWHRARPFESLEGAVRQVFGVVKLESLSTDDLRRVLAALTPGKATPKPAATSPRRRAALPFPTVKPCTPVPGAGAQCGPKRLELVAHALAPQPGAADIAPALLPLPFFRFAPMTIEQLTQALTALAQFKEPYLAFKITRDEVGFCGWLIAQHQGRIIAQFGNRRRRSLPELKQALCDYLTWDFKVSSAKRRWIEMEIERLNEKAARGK